MNKMSMQEKTISQTHIQSKKAKLPTCRHPSWWQMHSSAAGTGQANNVQLTHAEVRQNELENFLPESAPSLGRTVNLI